MSQLPSNAPRKLPHEVAVGELRLYRGWYLTHDRSLFSSVPPDEVPLSLRSSYVDYLWKPDVNEATHINGRNRLHASISAPMERCGCGIYGVFEPPNVQGNDIVGVVEYWGKVWMGSLGIRAQFARVVELAPGLHSNYRYTYWTERVKRRRLASIGQRYDARVHFSQRALIIANAGKMTVPSEFGITGEDAYIGRDFG